MHFNSMPHGQVKPVRSRGLREVMVGQKESASSERRIQISRIRSVAHDISLVIYTMWHRIEMQMKNTAAQDLPLIGNL